MIIMMIMIMLMMSLITMIMMTLIMMMMMMMMIPVKHDWHLVTAYSPVHGAPSPWGKGAVQVLVKCTTSNRLFVLQVSGYIPHLLADPLEVHELHPPSTTAERRRKEGRKEGNVWFSDALNTNFFFFFFFFFTAI